jgi:halimadienyl-diphosphate synthase
MYNARFDWPHILNGTFSPDIYSTAWVAMVPQCDNEAAPQWPAALRYLRRHQLPDGGWGADDVYYAHERTISTLAAILALTTVGRGDEGRIQAGLRALRRYATELADEQHEPIGFELLLPHLRDLLKPVYGQALPRWEHVDTVSQQKLSLLTSLEPDPDNPQSWWVNMEMLKDEQLAALDNDSMLDRNGALASSTAATAAFLRAKRLGGQRAPRARAYLDKLVTKGEGGVPFAWPAEMFERVWGVDSLLRGDVRLTATPLVEVVEDIHHTWHTDTHGLSFSADFPVNDGDDTLLGYRVLMEAGFRPDEAVVRRFWDGERFCAYPDERGASTSVNVHGLAALHASKGEPPTHMIEQATDWVDTQTRPDGLLNDKWHISPYYTTAHAVTAFAESDPQRALAMAQTLLDHQRPDGGWGWLGRSTQEETAHVVLGLYQAFRHGMLPANRALWDAARYFRRHRHATPTERLWIGKTLYRPDGIVYATLFAARYALSRLNLLKVENIA